MTSLRPHSQHWVLELLAKCSTYIVCHSPPPAHPLEACTMLLSPLATSFLGMGRPAPPFAPSHPPGLLLFSDLELYSPVSQSLGFFYFFFPKKFIQMLLFLTFIIAPLHRFRSASLLYTSPVCWPLARLEHPGGGTLAQKSYRWLCTVQSLSMENIARWLGKAPGRLRLAIPGPLPTPMWDQRVTHLSCGSWWS